MATALFKALCLVAILVIECVTCAAAAGGACGNVPPDKVALQLAPCAQAASSQKVKPSAVCCNLISSILKKNPRCLCAVLLSSTAKKAGVNVKIAKTIPLRCRLKLPKGSC